MLLAGCDGGPANDGQASSSAAAGLMSMAAEPGFRRASEPGSLRFPADHGPHPDFQSEWWYFTGNLASAEGRAFGFQLTLFRFALAAQEVPRASHFATRQVWMGHFAVSDLARRQFHGFERFARGAAGLAGADTAPLRVWVEDWRIDAVGPPGAEPFPLRLRAADGDVAIDLTLLPGHARVLQGDAGLSRKSAEAGNASYYYSHPRLPARGTVRVADGEFTVSGNAWLDREWSTSALARDQEGWDWFALHLDDGRNLMFYRLRDARGGMHPFSAGMISDRDGLRRRLDAAAVTLDELEHWRGPGGVRYPVAWRLRSGGLDLTVRARLADQEHRHGFRYWEGAVAVRGSEDGRPVSGSGYLEMTGY